MNRLKENVRAIQMDEDTRRRLASGFRPQKRRLSPVAIAAVLALALLLPVGTYAAGRAGFFRDVKRWDGAVVGTAYENATNEISVTAVRQDDQLLVTVTLLTPDKAPYPYIEELSIGEYQLLNEKGKVIVKGTVDAVPLISGQAEFTIPAIEGHTLRITEFISHKKAEQPLPISGEWELYLG